MSNDYLFGPGLLSTHGERHRIQRKILNPVFSTTHLREMTPTFYGVAHKLTESLALVTGTGPTEIDMLEWMTRTALELVGQSGYGYSFDTLEPDATPHPFAMALKNLFRSVSTKDLMLARFIILPYVRNIGTPRFRRAVVDILSVPWKSLRNARDLIDVMEETSVEILNGTRDAVLSGKELSSRIGGGKDIMSRLVKANMSASNEDKISDAELIAQISTITFGAMDTSSNALASMLHLLSIHQDVQKNLRKEVVEAYETYGGDLDYDTLMNLPLLNGLVRETLRLWPPVPMLARRALRDAVLPLDKPITSVNGQEISEIVAPENTHVLVSILSCNRDPKIWGPDAAEWKPERWLSPLPESVSEAHVPGVYSNLMTFTGGSRSCIGFKFAQLEIKIVLSILLKTFDIAPSGKTVIWQMNGITQPTTAEAEITPSGEKRLELPLKLSPRGQK